MTRTVAFFPHNLQHLKFFVQVGKYLKEGLGLETIFIRELGDVVGEEVFHFEKEIEERWNTLDISYASLCSLREQYPEAQLLRALYCERRLNFLPSYFGRKRFSYEWQLRYLIGCFRSFERLLDERKIDCVVSELLIGLPDSVLFEVCKKKGVRYFSLRESKLSKGVVLCNPESEAPLGAAETYSRFVRDGVSAEHYESAVTHLQELRSRIVAPQYMESSKKEFRLLDREKMTSLLLYFAKNRGLANSISRMKHPIRDAARWHLRRLFNIWLTRLNARRWFTERIDPEEKYFVFPLQYEPEASTLVRAFPFSEQACIIEHLAKILPFGITLAVKEHRGNHGYRKPESYKKLHYLPNIRLIPRHGDVHTLLRNCVGVITLSSRMGWEALVLRKPVITLGTSFWSDFEYVKHPPSFAELGSALEECLHNNPGLVDSEYDKKLIAFAAAYMSRAHEGTFLSRKSTFRSPENIKNIAALILSELDLPRTAVVGFDQQKSR